MHIKNYKDFLFENKADQDLVRKYFSISAKTTYFKVPLTIFKTSEKAFLMGYKNEEEKEISNWFPKIGVQGPYTTPVYFDIQPKEMYHMAWWLIDGDDKKKTQFFTDYAKFTEIMIGKDNEKSFNKEIEADDKISSYIINKLNKFFEFFGSDIVAEKVDIQDFEKYLYKVKTNHGDFTVMYRGDSYFRIDINTEKPVFLMKELNIKDYTQYFDILNIMKFLKMDTKKIEKQLLDLFKSVCKGYDKDYQYASQSSSRYQNGEYVNAFARELKKYGFEKEVKKILNV